MPEGLSAFRGGLMKTAIRRLLLTPIRFSVMQLFRMGQVGWAHWFDAPGLYPGGNHLYLYQDSVGTTPVTAVGQRIGLTLDRAYGGMRGAELPAPTASLAGGATNNGDGTFTIPASGSIRFEYTLASLVNGMLYEFEIERVGVASTGTISVDWCDGPDTVMTAAAAGVKHQHRDARATYDSTYRFLDVVAAAASSITFRINFARSVPGTHIRQNTSSSRPTLSARVNMLLNSATMSTQNVTTVATSYKLSFTGTGTVTLSGTSTAGPLVGTGATDRVSLTFTPTAGTLTLTVSGSVTLADLRTADDAAKNIPVYQRVGATAADHDTDGFPHGQYPDGTDDNQTTTTGGGGTTGFFYCGAITVSGGAGTARTIWSDTGTNTGYRVRVNSSDKLELAAGNGSAYTTVASNETITAPGTYILSAWDDGGVLAVQVNNLAPATTTRPTVSAGTAAITAYKDNGAASSYFNGRDYGSVYRQSYIGESQHARLKRWLADRARITL